MAYVHKNIVKHNNMNYNHDFCVLKLVNYHGNLLVNSISLGIIDEPQEGVCGHGCLYDLQVAFNARQLLSSRSGFCGKIPPCKGNGKNY